MPNIKEMMTFLCKKCDLFVAAENTATHLAAHVDAGEDMGDQAQWFRVSKHPELSLVAQPQVKTEAKPVLEVL
jgi:hypothetical protein